MRRLAELWPLQFCWLPREQDGDVLQGESCGKLSDTSPGGCEPHGLKGTAELIQSLIWDWSQMRAK